jgi:UDP-2,3-diacylglucosamine pyrophosphatase LpxH
MPGEEIKAHAFLLDGLFQLESVKGIKLVARLFDARINNQDSRRLHVLIPDMHLITRETRKRRKKRSFNHERLFVDLLKKLIELKRVRDGFPITVIQLGDCMDLWVEDPEHLEKIISDFQPLFNYLYRDKNQSCDAQILVGNHDAALIKYAATDPRWGLRLLLPIAPEPRALALHGDAFDWIEKLPDDLQRWAVHLFTGGPIQDIWNALTGGGGPKKLGNFIDLRKEKSLSRDITKPSLLGRVMELKREAAADIEQPIVNISKSHRFLKACCQRLKEMNRQTGLKINTVTLGHTHTAKLAVNQKPFVVVMDCGAWIGEYRVGKDKALPNCQIGVICGNDYRIYQLDPDPRISRQYEDQPVA